MSARLVTPILFCVFVIAMNTAHAEEKIMVIELESPKDKKQFLNSQIDVPARVAIFELNPTEGAAKYQIQVQGADKSPNSLREFEVPKEELKARVRLAPGQYQIRTRAVDAQGFFGKWSEWEAITVEYKSLHSFLPADGAVLKPKSDAREKFLFEWPDSRRSFGFLFVLRDAQGRILKKYKTQKTWTYEELSPASKYSWTAWPLRRTQWERDIAEDHLGELKYNRLTIQSLSPAMRKTAVYAGDAANVEKYEFEFLTLDENGRPGVPSFFESSNEDVQLYLTPDNYEVRTRPVFRDKTVGSWSKPYFFSVPFEEVQTIEPPLGMIFEPFEKKPFEVDLSWMPQPGSHSYGIFLYDEKGTLLRSFKSAEPKLSVHLDHDITYYWKVVALSEGQAKLDAPKGDTKLPFFRVEKYVRKRLVTAEEPSYLYAWGRYWASRIDYEGTNYDLDSIVRQPINGATGEVALGYWNMATSLGLMGHASLSGFNLSNKVYNYTGGGIDAGYRYTSRGGSRLRIWLGAAYRELPEFLRMSMSPEYDYHRIKSFGPRLQISYMNSLIKKPKYGYHLYGIVYRSDQDLGTPNNLPQVPQTSYTLGAFGTYKWTERTKLQVGYSYKMEAVSYESADRSGNPNKSINNGHFLNLSIEYGLVGD